MTAQATPDRRLRVASVQMESLPADKEADFAKIEQFVAKAAAQGVRVVVFPECCITGDWFLRNLSREQLAALAEPVPDGPSVRRLARLAQQHQRVGVDDDEIRTGNAMILDPYGRILAETWKAEDAMVVADLDASLLPEATSRLWRRARRPELYQPLTLRTGDEAEARKLKFEE